MFETQMGRVWSDDSPSRIDGWEQRKIMMRWCSSWDDAELPWEEVQKEKMLERVRACAEARPSSILAEESDRK